MRGKKIFKYIRYIILSILILLCIPNTKTEAVVRQTREFYVNDSANVLDYDLENYIISTNKSLNSQTGAQIVVVTVNSLEGKEIEEYANELFRQYGIGNKTKNNGVLILLSINDRKSRIEVGYGLEGVLNDAKTGRIQDNYMIPYYKENNWQEGIKNGYNAILEEVKQEYSISVDGSIEPVKGKNDDIQNFNSGVISFIFIASMVIVPLFDKKAKKITRIISAILLSGSTVLAIATSELIFIYIAFISFFILISSFFQEKAEYSMAEVEALLVEVHQEADPLAEVDHQAEVALLEVFNWK